MLRDHCPVFPVCAPFGWGEELDAHLTQYGLPQTYLRTKWHLDPSNRLATIHQRCRQDRQTDRQTGQRSDSIWRTVLQTVAQKKSNRLISESFKKIKCGRFLMHGVVVAHMADESSIHVTTALLIFSRTL